MPYQKPDCVRSAEKPVPTFLTLEMQMCLKIFSNNAKGRFLFYSCDAMVGFVVLVFCHANELPLDEESVIRLSGMRSRAVKKKYRIV